MKDYQEILARLSETASPTPISGAAAAEIRMKHPGIPEEYLAFLLEAGFGIFDVLSMYSGPVAASDIYPVELRRLRSIILFADDLTGNGFGFDKGNRYSIVEIDGSGDIYRNEHVPFRAYILSHFSDMLK